MTASRYLSSKDEADAERSASDLPTGQGDVVCKDAFDCFVSASFRK